VVGLSQFNLIAAPSRQNRFGSFKMAISGNEKHLPVPVLGELQANCLK